MVNPKGKDLRKELRTSVLGTLQEKTADTNRQSHNIGSLRSEAIFKKSSKDDGKWKHDLYPGQ